MITPRHRTLAAAALAVLGAATLVGCTPEVRDAESTALIEEFFAHLEAGEATEAAALIDVDIPDEFLDDDFYGGSAALPTEAEIVEVAGSDQVGAAITVRYTLDTPVTTLFQVEKVGDERKITWTNDSAISIDGNLTPADVIINDHVTIPIDGATHRINLLPGLYDFSYVDPTGTTEVGVDGANAFTLAAPLETDGNRQRAPENVSVNVSSIRFAGVLSPDVLPAVEAEIARLQTACAAEMLVGPSCPSTLQDDAQPAADPASVRWSENAGNGIELTRTATYSGGFSVYVDGERRPGTFVYAGEVSRGGDGDITFARE